jgi:hypothetical protein
MKNNLSRLFNLFVQIVRLPVARLCFRVDINPDDVKSTYKLFTKPHPRYKVFQNKSLGAALVDLTGFSSRDDYLKGIKGRNLGAHHAGKAKSRGYVVVEIDRNDFIDEIHAVNTSLEVRQGRPMDSAYLEKITYYKPDNNFKYYGVLNSSGKLMAYGEVGFYGNFAAFVRLLGHRNNDGIMHLMVTEIICRLIEDGTLRYAMYDTYFGANSGLKMFKTMLGFQPYRVKFSIQ